MPHCAGIQTALIKKTCAMFHKWIAHTDLPIYKHRLTNVTIRAQYERIAVLVCFVRLRLAQQAAPASGGLHG